MKKLLLPICAMLLCMTACKKEENNGILRLEVEHYTSDTKLHLDAAHFAVWDNNDEVLLNGDRKPVTVSNRTATISGVTTVTDYTAIYPSSWASKSGGTTSITYPRLQIYRENFFIAPMAATYEDGKLMFKNLGAVLAVNVNTPMTVERIEVTADGTTLINGTANVSFTGDRPTIGALSSGKNLTTLICNTEVPAEGKTFYIAMPPVSAKLTIKVYGDTYCYTKTQSSSHSLQANHGYSVSLSDGFTSTAMPTNYQIFYTASSKISNPTSIFISTHTFSGGQGIITCSQEITTIPESTFCNKTAITSITLPASVKTIGEKAFYGCNNLKTAIMPGVKTIGNSAFRDCTVFSVVSMPNVTSIGTNAFCNDQISYLSMPKVETIESRAFYNATASLKHVYCTRTSAPSISSNSFYVASTARLHLSLSEYNNLTWSNWSGQTYYDL